MIKFRVIMSFLMQYPWLCSKAVKAAGLLSQCCETGSLSPKVSGPDDQSLCRDDDRPRSAHSL